MLWYFQNCEKVTFEGRLGGEEVACREKFLAEGKANAGEDPSGC